MPWSLSAWSFSPGLETTAGGTLERRDVGLPDLESPPLPLSSSSSTSSSCFFDVPSLISQYVGKKNCANTLFRPLGIRNVAQSGFTAFSNHIGLS